VIASTALTFESAAENGNTPAAATRSGGRSCDDDGRLRHSRDGSGKNHGVLVMFWASASSAPWPASSRACCRPSPPPTRKPGPMAGGGRVPRLCQPRASAGSREELRAIRPSSRLFGSCPIQTGTQAGAQYRPDRRRLASPVTSCRGASYR
jgi:hypothetical protein